MSRSNVLQIVRDMRRKNKIKREMIDVDVKIRDNQKRVDLLENLLSYMQSDMTLEEVSQIIENMKSDYEERVDDYIIRKAEFSKERRAINKGIKDMLKEEKIEQAVYQLLEAIGENPNREGLLDTPSRVAKMYQEANILPLTKTFSII